MPTRKYEWKTSDEVAAEAIDRLIEKSQMTLREIQEATNSSLLYQRVRDIRKGLKAPVRLSEFIMICEVCHEDPVRLLSEIISETKRREKESIKKRRIKDESIAKDMIKSFSKGNDKTLGLAADVEKEKWKEARGGDGR